MNKIPLFVAALLTAPIAAGPALADPVKCVDAKGKTRYIDESMAALEKCTPVQDRMQIIPGQVGTSRTPSSGAAPADAKPASDGSSDAVAQAQMRLAAARKALADQEAMRYGNEKNYERVQERLKPFQDEVDKAQQALDDARKNAR